MQPTERALPLRHAVALGLLQGPAELLPISSSAHTTLLPWLAGWPYARLGGARRKSFEVALHAGAAIEVRLHFVGGGAERRVAGRRHALDLEVGRVGGGDVGEHDVLALELLAQALHLLIRHQAQRIVGLHAEDEMDAALPYLPPEEIDFVQQGKDYGFPTQYGFPDSASNTAPPVVTLPVTETAPTPPPHASALTSRAPGAGRIRPPAG